ncbi:MAG TPA: 2-amino-4-hydroxy-6-hydroxymethyldihydropteridine diphosphokinase [Thermoanaerobaculia bacterium]|jgi:2-amino-4-hydroxy-6-hydroxymethyldihydropteridine diphosphokinase|nr:2-amino-4-hydroxy-6-hydroxymethyldihydropteridine diphosphokinase [Thermoanaerobaculia bacterium]
MSEPAGTQAFVIGVGSNVEPERHLPEAVRLLGEKAEVLAVSSAWATAPVGPAGQPPFVNAAVLLRTNLDPARVKPELLRPVERAMGRVRSADRFAPRAIDLDFVAWEGGHLRAEGLELPDPDLLRHAHVALPASEVAPEWAHPQTGETFAAIAERLVEALPAAERPRRLPLSLA